MQKGTTFLFFQLVQPSVYGNETTCGSRKEKKHHFVIIFLTNIITTCGSCEALIEILTLVSQLVNMLPRYGQGTGSYCWGLFYFYLSLMFHKYQSKIYIYDQLSKCHFKPDFISLIFNLTQKKLINGFRFLNKLITTSIEIVMQDDIILKCLVIKMD